ncbi:hypothetical protein BJ973_001081 [Actinoplanes tereljensis]|uniref:SMODS and SLOG-associating 2TM effector domain-containing protein n=1 Tax=Paractinoplanes tereljensis TaxID=571912 RepID=A0A919NZ68_9ACTN|nr:SLATT domain-containing protein [Actinoplanes tereljensis]GIF26636.1 hypothetical protein Ate02nite_93660 [Actinoplanes tereljensis]
MSESNALQLVERHLSRGIDNIRGSRNYYRRGAQLQTVMLAVLSAATTLLIGLNAIYHNAALVAFSLLTAGLTTVASAWTSWFGFRQLWAANTVTLTRLWGLRDQIDYDKAKSENELPIEIVDKYHERLQEIFADHNQEWKKIRSSG